MSEFLFATGIENSYPTIRLPDGRTHRVDEMERCGHYRRWREDFALVRELGLRWLRYGPPYYLAHTGAGRYDWGFADETFHALDQLGIRVIADLCHFGVPDWLGDFQNPDWPALFAEYARAFAERYPQVRLFTPVNEVYIAAMFSARHGWWNERGTTDRTFVTALKHLAKANVLAMRAILEVRPDAVFVQSESTEYFHPESPEAVPHAEVLNQRRFVSLDLSYGHPVSADTWHWLRDNGMTRAEYTWFGQHHVRSRCVLGNDYYPTNEHLVRADGTHGPLGETFGYYVITRQYYDRYQLPVVHTETNVQDAAAAPGWLRKQWANLMRLRQDGVPVLGFTWYSLTDQVDWDVALREHNGRVNPCGLYDLDRQIRPVGEAYRKLVADWRPALPRGLRDPVLT
jgi:beta-glucosidase/6-phospho-beta-glucosidase/beta-galactosidase